MEEETPRIAHQRSRLARGSERVRCLFAVAIALGCVQSATTQRGPGMSWDDARRRAVVAPQAAIILQDGTDLRLGSPRFDEEAVRGAALTSCAGDSCEVLRRTLTVRRSQVARMSLRFASADEASAVTRGASQGGAGDARTAEPPSSLAVARPRHGDVPHARHAVYLSGTSLILSNGLGLNYSYRPIHAFAVSVGGGFSSFRELCIVCFSSSHEHAAAGGQVMAHLLLGGATFNFEFGLGLAVVETSSEFLYESSSEFLRAYPSAFLGMRIHPMNGGFLLRVGAGWEYGLAFGLSLSLGAAF